MKCESVQRVCKFIFVKLSKIDLPSMNLTLSPATFISIITSFDVLA